MIHHADRATPEPSAVARMASGVPPPFGEGRDRGYHFKGTGTYGPLLTGDALVEQNSTLRGVPDGTRQVVARALTVRVRGIAHAA